jgi:hypothetical protein
MMLRGPCLLTTRLRPWLTFALKGWLVALSQSSSACPVGKARNRRSCASCRADDFLQPLGYGFDGGRGIVATSSAPEYSTFCWPSALSAVRPMSWASYASGLLQPLEESPTRAGIVELGLLVPAGGRAESMGGRAILALSAESVMRIVSEFRP